MTGDNSHYDIENLLDSIGYKEPAIKAIRDELEALFRDIGFDGIKHAINSAQEAEDTERLISSLKDQIKLLENKGYYRPDAPTRLIRLLVNGLNLQNEDIFAVLETSGIPEREKSQEQELLASCAAITQLGYILLSLLVPGVKAASAGPHVFTIVDGFSQGSMVFVDFSIDSVIDIDIMHYRSTENYFYLEKPLSPGDDETSKLLAEYYSFFHVTAGIGLGHIIHNNLGIAYDKIGRYDEAVREIKEALRLDPGYIEARNNLAVAYDGMGRIEEAIAELREALRLNPEYTEAHCNLGNIYARSGRYEDGIKELKEALRINPAYAQAHNALGNIYAGQKREEEAMKEFREALGINPEYAPAHYNLGNAYAEQGRYEEARKEFEEALRLVPEFPEAYHGIGQVYYSLGSYDRAVHAFINAVYLAPELQELVPEKLGLKVRQGILRLKRI